MVSRVPVSVRANMGSRPWMAQLPENACCVPSLRPAHSPVECLIIRDISVRTNCHVFRPNIAGASASTDGFDARRLRVAVARLLRMLRR